MTTVTWHVSAHHAHVARVSADHGPAAVPGELVRPRQAELAGAPGEARAQPEEAVLVAVPVVRGQLHLGRVEARGADEEAVGLQPGVSVIELVPGPEHGEAEVVGGREPVAP